MGKITIESDNVTGTKFLHIDNYARYGNKYVVRVYVKRKVFVIWRGNDKAIGRKVVKEMLKHLNKSEANFLDWYDNEREGWLEENEY